MVKTYFKYIYSNSYGIEYSGISNILYSRVFHEIISGGNEYAIFTKLKSGEISNKLTKDQKNIEITYLCLNEEENQLSIGYKDGEILVFDLENKKTKQWKLLAELNGHKSAITILIYSKKESHLFSGSNDTKIIVWDIISESALYKLSGHKNSISFLQKCTFFSNIKYDVLISSAKDGIIKVWDLYLSQSVQTIALANSEITKFVYIEELNCFLISAANSDKFIVYKVNIKYDEENKCTQFLELIGEIARPSYARIICIELEKKENRLYCLNSDSKIEIYQIFNKEELEKKLKKKKKRKIDDNFEGFTENLVNYFLNISVFHLNFKVKGFVLINSKSFCVGSANNSLVTYQIIEEKKNLVSYKENVAFDKIGLPSTIKKLALSSNDHILLSSSLNNLKVWGLENENCDLKHNMVLENIVNCVVFLPKDKLFVVGFKKGGISVYNCSSAELLCENYLKNSVASIDMHEKPNGFQSIVILSGESEKKLKFWEIALKNVNNKNILHLNLIKSIEMIEEILFVKYTPNGNYYCVALLDSSVRVYFSDSDKLFLNLYGHKLPISCFDCSTDNTLLLTGSNDKNVKLWGLDFGDIKKSIYTHQEEINCVKFIRDTHYFLSGGKENGLKLWDGDTYQQIQEFEESLGEINWIECSQIGDFIICGGTDKALRFYLRSTELIVAQDIKDFKKEKLLVEDWANKEFQKNENEENNDNYESGNVEKKKLINLKYGEEIMNALDLIEKLRSEEDENNLIDFKTFKELGGLNVSEYFLKIMKNIKLAEIENSLKFVHFSYIERILEFLKLYVNFGKELEMVSRIINFILENYEGHLKNSEKLINILKEIQLFLRNKLEKEKKTIGFNLIALKIVSKELGNQKMPKSF